MIVPSMADVRATTISDTMIAQNRRIRGVLLLELKRTSEARVASVGSATLVVSSPSECVGGISALLLDGLPVGVDGARTS